MEEEQKRDEISYKINTANTYMVYENVVNGKSYYNIPVYKKNYDETKTYFKKQVKFVKCNPPRNGEIIRIKRGFEDLYTNSKDIYNAISVIIILEYEVIKGVNEEYNPFKEYRDKIDENNEMVEINDGFLD